MVRLFVDVPLDKSSWDNFGTVHQTDLGWYVER